ncbi:GDP-mannose 4,6-dehydratase [Candidatus Daviesbacteria bacterium]|nr:GDP-mannose 4,6-dehydratase [Candidatus Daviesbacteria bacterium]
MKILVTGGAGFLGSNLCSRLLNDGEEVFCLDNLLTGRKENIEDLLKSPLFKFENLDAAEVEKLGDIQFDRVYHLASPASPNRHAPRSYLALPFETMKINSIGTWVLAQFAQTQGAKFLFASTSEIYGDPLKHPQKEEYRGNVSTTGLRSVYDESKRFGETITTAFVRYKDLDGRIVRIFNTYGPRMDRDGRVVIEFVMAALNGDPLPIFGDGKQTRSFCFVDDLIEGIIKAMESENTKGEVFNLGNEEEFTILELAEMVKKVTGSTSEVEIKEALPEDDPIRRKPDISKAKRVLDWEPKVKLEKGLNKLVEYLKSKDS